MHSEQALLASSLFLPRVGAELSSTPRIASHVSSSGEQISRRENAHSPFPVAHSTEESLPASAASITSRCPGRKVVKEKYLCSTAARWAASELFPLLLPLLLMLMLLGEANGATVATPLTCCREL